MVRAIEELPLPVLVDPGQKKNNKKNSHAACENNWGGNVHLNGLLLKQVECHLCFPVCSNDDQQDANHQTKHLWLGEPDITQFHHF